MNLAETVAYWGEQAVVWGSLALVASRAVLSWAPGMALRLLGRAVAFQTGELALSRGDAMARGAQALGRWISAALGRMKDEDWRKLAHGSREKLEAFEKWSAAQAARVRLTRIELFKRIGLAFVYLGGEIKHDCTALARWVRGLLPKGPNRTRQNFDRLSAIMGNVDDHVRPALAQIAEIEARPMREWEDGDWAIHSAALRFLTQQGHPVDEAKATYVETLPPPRALPQGLLGVGAIAAAAAPLGLKAKLIGAAAPIAVIAALTGMWLYEKGQAADARTAANAPCTIGETQDGAKAARGPCVELGRAQRDLVTLGLQYDALKRTAEEKAKANIARAATGAATAKGQAAQETKRRLNNVARAKPKTGGAAALMPPPDVLRLEPLEAPVFDTGGDRPVGAGDPDSGPVP